MPHLSAASQPEHARALAVERARTASAEKLLAVANAHLKTARHRVALAYFALVCLCVLYVASLVMVSRNVGTDPQQPVVPPVTATATFPTQPITERTPPATPTPSVPTLVPPR